MARTDVPLWPHVPNLVPPSHLGRTCHVCSPFGSSVSVVVTLITYSKDVQLCYSAPCQELISGKPDIMLDYNMNKGGVDTCDKICAAYSACMSQGVGLKQFLCFDKYIWYQFKSS